MPGLGHRKGPGKLERRDLPQVALVVAPRAELMDRAAPQPELDPELDHQRQVAERQGLKRGHVRPGVPATAELLGEAGRRQPIVGEHPRPRQHLASVVVRGYLERLLELRPRQDLAHLGANRRVATVEQALERRRVELPRERGDRPSL